MTQIWLVRAEGLSPTKGVAFRWHMHAADTAEDAARSHALWRKECGQRGQLIHPVNGYDVVPMHSFKGHVPLELDVKGNAPEDRDAARMAVSPDDFAKLWDFSRKVTVRL